MALIINVRARIGVTTHLTGAGIDGGAVLVGGSGTGETHITTALSVQAIEHHRKGVRFFSKVELVNALEQEKAQGRAG